MSIDLPKAEEEVLRRWQDIDAFQRQLSLSAGRPRYTFCDGPPFATGMTPLNFVLEHAVRLC